MKTKRSGTMTTFSVLAAAWLLAGCVNVHVHFPAAPDVPAATAKPADSGNDKK